MRGSESILENPEYQSLRREYLEEHRREEKKAYRLSLGLVAGFFIHLGGALAESAVFTNALTGPPAQRAYWQDVQDKVNLAGAISREVGGGLVYSCAGMVFASARKRK